MLDVYVTARLNHSKRRFWLAALLPSYLVAMLFGYPIKLVSKWDDCYNPRRNPDRTQSGPVGKQALKILSVVVWDSCRSGDGWIASQEAPCPEYLSI